MQSLNSAVVLSQGGTWKPESWETPFLIPYSNGLKEWPPGSSAIVTFTGTNGQVIGTPLEGVVHPDRIEFIGDPDDMNGIPAGANFTITLETKDGIFPIRYGKVIRKEVYYTTPPAQHAIPPLMLNDNLQRTALGRKWIAQYSSMASYDGSPYGLPRGWGAQSGRAAIRYWQEFTSNSIEIGVSFLNGNPNIPSSASVIFNADIAFNMGMAVRFETGSPSVRRIHIGTMQNPVTVIDRAPTVPDTVANNDYYKIRYQEELRTVAVYKGTSLDPIHEWTDETEIVPVGRGYRHLGANFLRSNNEGILLTSISARDAA